MDNEHGRVAEATGLSQVEPQEGLARSGFDPSRDPTPWPFWLVLTEQNLAIRFSFDNGNYALDFRVFSAAEGGEVGSDVLVWGLYDGSDSHEFSEWEQAFWEISGAVKWDGCINWHTNPECMVHGCGPRHAAEVHAIFAAVYAAGGWFYDYLGDDPPPMPAGVINVRDSDGSGEAGETGTGSTEGNSADPKGIAQGGSNG